MSFAVNKWHFIYENIYNMMNIYRWYVIMKTNKRWVGISSDVLFPLLYALEIEYGFLCLKISITKKYIPEKGKCLSWGAHDPHQCLVYILPRTKFVYLNIYFLAFRVLSLAYTFRFRSYRTPSNIKVGCILSHVHVVRSLFL